MLRNSRLLSAALGLLFVGAISAQAADDPPANPPARPRLQGILQGGGAGSAMLLRAEVVQKDLQLSDEQKESITKLQDKAREAFSGLQGLSDEERRTKMQELRKDQEEQLGKILNDKQKARLKEIGLQQAGALGLANKDVAESLKLTDDQVNKIKELADNYRTEMRDAVQAAAGGDPTSIRDALTKLRKESNEKILAVLKDDQKAAYEKMQGAKIELPAGGFFGAGRPRGGN